MTVHEYSNLIGGALEAGRIGRVPRLVQPCDRRAPRPGSRPATETTPTRRSTPRPRAFPAWSATPRRCGPSYLDRVAHIFEEHGEELARLESADNGNLIGVSEPMNGIAMVEVWKRAAHETVAASTGQSVVLDAEHVRRHAP